VKVILKYRFKKNLNKLLPKIQEQFLLRLDIFMHNPTDMILNNHSVERSYPDCRSINVNGDYRAIFYIQDGIAIFVDIGTHSELYG